MRTVRYKWVRIALLMFGLWILAAFILLDPLIRGSVKRDRLEALPRAGVATVVIVIPSRMIDPDHETPPEVRVRINGQLCAAQKVMSFTELHAGQLAQVVYRVGKSGRIYVDSVAPLPPAAARNRS